MSRLLIVEDERKLLRSLQRGLEAEGFEVATAANGNEGQALLASDNFDCAILDWLLPGRDGLGIVADLRRAGKRVPVLMLTARDAIEHRVLGLEQGADDYLVKPFAFAELVARVRALLRRGPADRESILRTGNLEVDLLDRRVVRSGQEIPLRAREFDVLVFLLRHEGQVVTREMLGREVWKEPDHTLTNVIDVTINLLRKKLDKGEFPSLIQTVRGVGYCLAKLT